MRASERVQEHHGRNRIRRRAETACNLHPEALGVALLHKSRIYPSSKQSRTLSASLPVRQGQGLHPALCSIPNPGLAELQDLLLSKPFAFGWLRRVPISDHHAAIR